MGRPDYDDSSAGDDDGQDLPNTQADTTGWLQHGRDSDNIQTRED